MAEPVRARRLTDDEGRRLQQIVRRGITGPLPANPLNPASHYVHAWDIR